jgi:hypothetical protein
VKHHRISTFRLAQYCLHILCIVPCAFTWERLTAGIKADCLTWRPCRGKLLPLLLLYYKILTKSLRGMKYSVLMFSLQGSDCMSDSGGPQKCRAPGNRFVFPAAFSSFYNGVKYRQSNHHHEPLLVLSLGETHPCIGHQNSADRVPFRLHAR